MPVLSDRIHAAIEAIGPDRSKDYQLKPVAHATEYAQKAPDLSRLLRSSKIQEAAESYEKLNHNANEARDRFNAESGRARKAVLAAGVAGAMLLAAASLTPLLGEGAARGVIIFATALGVVAGGLGAMWIRSIRRRGLFERWMRIRAAAEFERLHYFELVTREGRLAEPLLQLEYFRRYQLDVQRNYYRDRGADHAAAADRKLTLATTAMGAGGIITALAGAFAASVQLYLASIAGLALVAQAIAAYFENEEATAQHRRNAERYERTERSLDKLAAMLDDVRTATEAGELPVMHEFIASVHDQLSVEHRQWIDEMGDASEAVNRLQGLLDQYQAKFEAAGDPAHPFVRVDDALLPRRDGRDSGAGAASRAAIVAPAEAALPHEAIRYEENSDAGDDGSFEGDPGLAEEELSGEADPRGQ